MSYSRRRFINIAAIGMLSSAANREIFSINKERKRDQSLVGDGSEHQFNDISSYMVIEGKAYGARADDRGAIGGASGYAEIFTGGDYIAENIQDLEDALSKARKGDVIFIPSECSFDLTTLVYIDKFTLKIPSGVTLASDRGHVESEGAIIFSDAFNTSSLIRAGGSQVRVTGLRIKGPNANRHMEHYRRSFGKNGLGKEYYYKFPVSRGIVTEYDELVVDNCELSGFSQSAIRLIKGENHDIHHNYIHHCQYNGLGYGISHSRASSLIEYNLFDSNRHSIAGTGDIGCSYIARNNIELGESLSHCFDMHGGRDRKDGTNIAGTRVVICNNTFNAPEKAVVIRGEPEEECIVYQNWFLKHSTPEAAIHGYERTKVFDNLFGKKIY